MIYDSPNLVSPNLVSPKKWLTFPCKMYILEKDSKNLEKGDSAMTIDRFNNTLQSNSFNIVSRDIAS